MEYCLSSVKKNELLVRQPKDTKLHHSFCHKYDIPVYWVVLDYSVNQNLSFESKKKCPSWTLILPWYNTTICLQLHGSLFENYLTTKKRDKYNLMCSNESHAKNLKSRNEHKPVNDDSSSGGTIPLPSNSTEEALKPFLLTLNPFGRWIK